MSKKNSYMDRKNILSEGALMQFLRGLFKGKKGLERDAYKLEKKLDKNVKTYNKIQGDLEKSIEKMYGTKVELDRITVDDVVKSAKAR
jgi:hypothetical protein